MIRVYFLPVTLDDNTEVIACQPNIHDAILETTELPLVRKLIQDCTPEERQIFSQVALEARDPTQTELDAFNAMERLPPPSPDYIRACEILGQSPDVITQPEIWELLRIFGTRLGYRFD